MSFVNLIEVEELAKIILPGMVYDYYAGGSESCASLQDNRQVYSRIKLIPRILRDVSGIDTSTTILGK